MTDFTATRALFHIPPGVIYLDGNSLGPLPLAAEARAARVLRAEWGDRLIRAWNEAEWSTMPARVGDRIARLIGAPPGSVTTGDTLSIKVFQALAAALALRPERRVVLSDSGNFPTDLYIADALCAALGRGLEVKVVAPEEVADAIDESVAVVMLTQVDYRTGRLHDMAALTERAHAAGAVTVWDLAHSAGALPVDVTAAGADFAIGCTYKYLNGGPGAPAFIHVADAHANVAQPILAGWFGHDAPFAFERGYRPAPGVERMRVGTPPIVALSILDAALDAWEGVDMTAVRAASIRLSETFIREVEARCPQVTLASPRDPYARGSQVSVTHPHAYPVMQALIARGVIGDVRQPDVLRFGFTPLYLSEDEVVRAADILADILATGEWDQPQFHARANVT
ncbi:kynureninase [Sphingomonas endophytica]|uniref:Kynureninase n=1 Tax=Sphingomonas endophytica TaxID=869719 RepID=A0A147I519_9SPHN|nr:kynureninase [Sphingomonas endophytica]KTT73696.1 kynureninase [Sphingomonas endophytica]